MTLRATDPYECFCGRTYMHAIDLDEHRRARGHFPSHVCGKSCKHPRVDQYDFTSRRCGYCGKPCERLDILEDHCTATGHCFCSECDHAFESQTAWKNHRDAGLHASEYRCCNCDISFKNIHALNVHIERSTHGNAKKAKKATVVSAGHHVCKRCQRTFHTLESLQQHSESIKHKPLSALGCPAGEECKGKFNAPSALLHHLESGKCCSGMDRYDINNLVQLHDKDGTIHTIPKLTPSTSAYLSANGLSPYPGTPLLSVDSSDGWSLVTPTHSHGSVEGSLLDWSLIKNGLLSLEKKGLAESKPRCPLCPGKRKAFATAEALQQHIESPVHCDKVYHCPSTLFKRNSNEVETKREKKKQFTTLSGLAQHLESGACHGGKKTFLYCIELIQQHLEQCGLGGMRLLLPDSQD